MPYIELIKIRTGVSDSREIFGVLQEILAAVGKSMPIGKVALYRHGSVPGDYAFFLFRDGETVDPAGTSEGIKIRESLESYGIVDHTTWALIELP